MNSLWHWHPHLSKNKLQTSTPNEALRSPPLKLKGPYHAAQQTKCSHTTKISVSFKPPKAVGSGRGKYNFSIQAANKPPKPVKPGFPLWLLYKLSLNKVLLNLA